MQEQGFDVLAVYFKLPFNKNAEEEVGKFAKENKIKLKIFDCTSGDLLKDYLKIIKKPEFCRGAGINPCIDCRIFLLKKIKKFAKEKNIKIIVTGEVLGERPMSQTLKSINLIEKKSGLKGKILRPLSAKFFEKINAEKEGLINRNSFYDICGRRREMQMQLAKKFKIDYPAPAGGCLLCEKELKKRFKTLLKKRMNHDKVRLLEIGRHFLIDKVWIVLGRNEHENNTIEGLKNKYLVIMPDFIGPSAIILDKCNKKIKQDVSELVRAYSKQGELGDRDRFEKWRL